MDKHVPTEAESAALSLRLSESMKDLEVTALRVKAERDRMQSALRQILCEVEEREDIEDGEGWRPNIFMRIAQECREALGE